VPVQARATFFAISASSLTSKWHGEAEKLVRPIPLYTATPQHYCASCHMAVLSLEVPCWADGHPHKGGFHTSMRTLQVAAEVPAHAAMLQN
jgi:hypothetical protein